MRCSFSPSTSRSFQCISRQKAQPLICDTRSLSRCSSFFSTLLWLEIVFQPQHRLVAFR